MLCVTVEEEEEEEAAVNSQGEFDRDLPTTHKVVIIKI